MTYTYRGGRRIELDKSADEFVVRAAPEALGTLGATNLERVSPSSTRGHVAAGELDATMARSRDIAPTHHVYTVAESGQDFLITDRVFVSFRQPLDAEAVAAFAGRYGLLQCERYSDRDFLFQLTNDTGMNPIKLVVKLSEDEPQVEMAENDLNYLAEKQALVLPTDPEYLRQWHLHGRMNHPQVDPRANARCEAAWQLLDGYGSHDIVVGVTDDGCRLDHPDFDSDGKFAQWGYFVGNRLVTRGEPDANPSGMYQAGANHGTSCAGVIAGEVDGVLTVGAAPGCRLLPIKWESQGPSLLLNDSKLLAAINFIADKVDVLSNSWGIVPLNLTATVVVNRIRALALTGGRRGKGILFLWAAGNDNCPINHVSNRDVPYSNGWGVVSGAWRWVGVRTARRFENSLADVPGVLHVAALASTARRSHYSNYGSGVDLCAPTSNSHSYWRMEVAGLGVTTTTGESVRVTADFGGTSSATPLVAGVAALVLSANPQLAALEVASILCRSASRDLDMSPYPRTPPASFDPNPTWDISPVAPFDSGGFTDSGLPDGSWSPWFGHGRVDAAAAVALARQGTVITPPADTLAGQYRSTPDKPIPDNQPVGVRDVIRVGEQGLLASLVVGVDISHTFIGDLVVSLISPSGRSVRLHDRAGGNADDLVRSWDLASLPMLQGFIGEPAAGDWTLVVQDLAPVDAGRLRAWSLTIETLGDAPIEVSEAPGVTIPDNRASGISRKLDVAEAGSLSEIEVSVDITHTYIGDLRVGLRSPAGSTVWLHDRSGGSTDNLRATWSSASVASLAALVGQEIAGSWTLQVSDHESADVGKLNRWGLRLVRRRVLASAGSQPRKRKSETGKGSANSAKPSKLTAAENQSATPKSGKAPKSSPKAGKKTSK